MFPEPGTLCARDWKHKEEQNVDLPFYCFQARVFLNTDMSYHCVIEDSHSLVPGEVGKAFHGRGCLSCVLRMNRSPTETEGGWASQTEVIAVQRHRGLKLYDVPRNPQITWCSRIAGEEIRGGKKTSFAEEFKLDHEVKGTGREQPKLCILGGLQVALCRERRLGAGSPGKAVEPLACWTFLLQGRSHRNGVKETHRRWNW